MVQQLPLMIALNCVIIGGVCFIFPSEYWMMIVLARFAHIALMWLLAPVLKQDGGCCGRELADHPSEDSFYDPHSADGPGDRLGTSPFPKLDEPASIALTVVVPAYNEEERLPMMLKSTVAFLEERRVSGKGFGAAGTPGALEYEIIVVDDGSRDGTAEIVKEWTRV
jgi:hypothetical protein